MKVIPEMDLIASRNGTSFAFTAAHQQTTQYPQAHRNNLPLLFNNDTEAQWGMNVCNSTAQCLNVQA